MSVWQERNDFVRFIKIVRSFLSALFPLMEITSTANDRPLFKKGAIRASFCHLCSYDCDASHDHGLRFADNPYDCSRLALIRAALVVATISSFCGSAAAANFAKKQTLSTAWLAIASLFLAEMASVCGLAVYYILKRDSAQKLYYVFDDDGDDQVDDNVVYTDDDYYDQNSFIAFFGGRSQLLLCTVDNTAHRSCSRVLQSATVWRLLGLSLC